jgi:hypothetical protein
MTPHVDMSLADARRQLAAVRTELAQAERDRTELLSAVGGDATFLQTLEDALAQQRKARQAGMTAALQALGEVVALSARTQEPLPLAVDELFAAIATLPRCWPSTPAKPPRKPAASTTGGGAVALPATAVAATTAVTAAAPPFSSSCAAPQCAGGTVSAAPAKPVHHCPPSSAAALAAPPSGRFRRKAPARLSVPVYTTEATTSAVPVLAPPPSTCTKSLADVRLIEPVEVRQLPLSARSAHSICSIESYSSC